MSWIVTAVVATTAFSVGSSVLQAKATKKANKQAQKDALQRNT